jgi:hypothetical protein
MNLWREWLIIPEDGWRDDMKKRALGIQGYYKRQGL